MSTFRVVGSFSQYGRSGVLKTRRGLVNTPFFMPVATRGAAKGLSSEQVTSSGAQVLLENAYHLHLSPGEKVVKKLGGLHTFSNWDGQILTDSGGFQVFSLSKIRKITEEGVEFREPESGRLIFISPEDSVRIQWQLGSDIIMAFDDVVGLGHLERRRSREAMERTHRWLIRSITQFNKLTHATPPSKRPLLFGIAQGGLDKQLRLQSIEFVQSQPVDGVAIGGLSVGETTEEMHTMLSYIAPILDTSRVHYLMGVGEPADMQKAISCGIDMFDCVLPTRNGRHGSLWVGKNKKINLTNLIYKTDPKVIDKGCDCQSCTQGYSRALLRQLLKTNNPLGGTLASIHNLRFLQRLCESYRL